MPDFLANREEMEDLLVDSLERPDPAARLGTTQINWLAVCVALMGLAGLAVAAAWYWRRSTASPAGLPAIVALPGQGMGRWLLLVGLGLCLSPLIRIVAMASSWEGCIAAEVWQRMAMPHGGQLHPLVGPLLILELLGNTALLSLNALALGLHGGRWKCFPRVYVGFVMLNAVVWTLSMARSRRGRATFVW